MTWIAKSFPTPIPTYRPRTLAPGTSAGAAGRSPKGGAGGCCKSRLIGGEGWKSPIFVAFTLYLNGEFHTWRSTERFKFLQELQLCQQAVSNAQRPYIFRCWMPGMESFFRVFFVEFRTWRSHVRSGVAPSGSWRRRASVGADLQGKKDKKVGFLGACYLAYMSLFALVI